jgi:voltage-gated potassium channel Kch
MATRRHAPPWLFAAAYLGMVPLFAILYTQHPYEFYHSTVRYEPVLSQERAAAAAAIKTAVARSYSRNREPHWRNAKGWSFVVEDFDVLLLGVTDQRASFVIYADLESDAARSTVTTGYWLSTILSGSRTYDDDREKGQVYCVYDSAHEDVEHREMELTELLPWPADLRSTHSHGGMAGHLTLRPSERDSILGYGLTSAGTPGTSGANFERMLYLSIVTITTLGYGDIVPLTPRARLLIGCEALAGIVFAGLFLNALAARTTARLRRIGEQDR